MHINWIDWIIFFVVLYQVVDGWDRGLVALLSNTLAFLMSLWLAVRFHGVVGAFVVEKFGLPGVWKNVLGYVLIAMPSEVVIDSLLEWPLRKVPPKIVASVINRWFGSLFAAANALLFVAFLLLVVVALPIRGSVKRDIKNSAVGSKLVLLSERFGGNVKSSLDSLTQEALKFVTIKPKSNERLNLDITPESNQLTVDGESEQRMMELVNVERAKRGLTVLRVEENLVSIARKHSRDMFERKYFSHYSPEGKDVGFRAREGGIEFTLVGENLAYAPDVEMAHTGLMNSEGHRKNILDTAWTRIGVGVIDGDVYGKMFTQVYAN